ncbi:hypothetical protein [Curtobacterium sp. MCSS17_007]|uniref:hypothetical protein n=1 Tax=Curtobacterium sp. MCSS17_007 TaxID=2175646 RepID=UPI000DAA2ED7|nr:hypothetical protein [Curtobacterium sp. MCSS17_007]WIE75408.1 hypothetical protein DEJ22_014350 [Curtobacterium sp. MCSS17_007]
MGSTRGAVRIVVAVVGVVVVAAYAALIAVNALVLDPLAAVPGATLPQIHARVDAAGTSVAGDVRGVVVVAAVGVVLALAASIVGLAARLPATVVAVMHLGVLAAGALATFQSGFWLGTDVADTFPTHGGAHTIWSGVLYMTSLAALVAIPVVLFVATVRTRNTQRRRRLAAE